MWSSEKNKFIFNHFFYLFFSLQNQFFSRFALWYSYFFLRNSFFFRFFSLNFITVMVCFFWATGQPTFFPATYNFNVCCVCVYKNIVYSHIKCMQLRKANLITLTTFCSFRLPVHTQTDYYLRCGVFLKLLTSVIIKILILFPFSFVSVSFLRWVLREIF